MDNSLRALALCYGNSLQHQLNAVHCAAYSTDCMGRIIDTAAPLFLAYVHFKHVTASLKSREAELCGNLNYIPAFANILFSTLAAIGTLSYMSSLNRVARAINSESGQLLKAANGTAAYIEGMEKSILQSVKFDSYINGCTAVSGGIKIALASFTLYSTAYLLYRNFEAGKNPFKIYPIKIIVILVSAVALIGFSIFQIVMGDRVDPSNRYMKDIDYCNSLF